MAAEESTAMSYEKIYDMGTGLIIAKVQLDKVREQDINARIMKKEMQDQLTANIKNRGQLESLPLLVEKDGVLEIISGHHRIKSARAAGMKEIIAIIDVSGLSRSKIASKQLAHNAISGFDDPSILREICKMLDDVDDMLESFIGKDIMEEPLEQYDKLLSPAVHFDFKNITFSFLPHQVKDMDALVKNLESSAPEIIGVAPYEQCKQFIEALADGGVACGLPRAKAQEYAAQMVLGSAKLVLESGKHPGALKDAVCSPGGSTIQGVRVLEEHGLRGAVMDAVLAAYDKTKEMGKG